MKEPELTDEIGVLRCLRVVPLGVERLSKLQTKTRNTSRKRKE